MRWFFTRDAEQLELHRPEDRTDGERIELHVTRPPDPTRVYVFDDDRARARFQVDMEAMLVGTGWLLARFEPERRHGRDRRRFPRLDERRRWWTDPPPSEHAESPLAGGRRHRR